MLKPQIFKSKISYLATKLKIVKEKIIKFHLKSNNRRIIIKQYNIYQEIYHLLIKK